MKNAKKIFNLICALLVILFSACSEDENDGYQPTPDESASVELTSSNQFGKYLVDAAGRTLYFFTKDASGSSVCEGGCLAAWPAFKMEGNDIGDGLNTADFGTITRADGTQQTTYKGWPLYYFGGDAEAGQINGDGSGEVWYVAKPDYVVMLATQDVAGASETYLVDDKGNTLYRFTQDTTDQSACEGGCLNAWPIFDPEADEVIVPSALTATDFSSFSRAGNVLQLTFKGVQLYFYVGDNTRGDVNGIGIENWLIIGKTAIAGEI